MNLDDLTEEQKANVMELIILTVKEIREQIAMDIQATSQLWKSKGLNKSRRTQKAFDISAAIARGEHERGFANNINVTTAEEKQ
jgi:hypothetical protein